MLRLPIRRRTLVIAIALGMLSGFGGFTFRYAEGFSYFSSDPKNCANCHIMQQQYDSWSRSTHHHVAGCVECHLPHDTIPKLIAKADNGYHHSKGFTMQDFHEPIMITPKNAQILQENCVRCHSDFVHNIVPGSSTSDPQSVQCVHCHQSVGHGPRSWGR